MGIKGAFCMIKKILFSALLAIFITACATTPKDTAGTSGSGSSGADSGAGIVPSSGDASILDDLINTPLGGPSSVGVDESSSDYDSLGERFIVEVGDRVYFDYDSAELDADAQELLQHQVAFFKQHNILSITIEGHCDERGTREYNLALGEKRAQAVKNYLNGLAVFPAINTISYGKERPAVIGSNDGAWSQNRRSVTKLN